MSRLIIGIVVAVILGMFVFLMIDPPNLAPPVKPRSTGISLPSGCVQNVPSVTVTPPSQLGSAGATLNYDIGLRNNNVGCGTVQFFISDVLMFNPTSGWNSQINAPSNLTNGTTVPPNPVRLCDGCSMLGGNYVLSSSSTAIVGNYPFIVIATENGRTQGGAGQGTYII
ncbi:MAG: hypothetical protein AABX23_00915 [Nanoarchaeota archaeon]